MIVTFDSNAWQPVVRPDKCPKDLRQGDFVRIHEAVRAGKVEARFVETVASLEAIKKADRATYLASRRPAMEIAEKSSQGRIQATVTIGPDHSAHPGLAPVLEDRIGEALALGFRFMRLPRIGTQLPPVALVCANYVQQSTAEAEARQERSFEALREIEARGVGKSQVEEIGNTINMRHGAAGPWFTNLDKGTPDEFRQIAKGVAEWADADSVAAHIGYRCDYFCTEDAGKSAGDSILDAKNRAWLESKYGLQFVTLSEFAAKI